MAFYIYSLMFFLHLLFNVTSTNGKHKLISKTFVENVHISHWRLPVNQFQPSVAWTLRLYYNLFSASKPVHLFLTEVTTEPVKKKYRQMIWKIWKHYTWANGVPMGGRGGAECPPDGFQGKKEKRERKEKKGKGKKKKKRKRQEKRKEREKRKKKKEKRKKRKGRKREKEEKGKRKGKEYKWGN